MRDHMLSANHGWGRGLFETEREKFPVSFERLAAYPNLAGMTIDLNSATRQLWTFTSRHVTKSFRSTLTSPVDGQELNGLELWRVLYTTMEGGASEVELADLGALHKFPECKASSELSLHLGTWVALVQEQGKDLPDRHLGTLLLKMLPPDAYGEVKRMNRLQSHYLDIVRFLNAEAHRFIDQRVAKVHVQSASRH